MDVKIDKGIPIPVRNVRGTIVTVFQSMSIGDSFVWPASYTQTDRAVRASATYAGVKVSIRKQPDGTFRVWRTA